MTPRERAEQLLAEIVKPLMDASYIESRPRMIGTIEKAILAAEAAVWTRARDEIAGYMVRLGYGENQRIIQMIRALTQETVKGSSGVAATPRAKPVDPPTTESC